MIQELTFKQMEEVSGGKCTASRVANKVVQGAFTLAGSIIGGATTFGVGASVGSFAGTVVGALAWEGMRDETVAALCEK